MFPLANAASVSATFAVPVARGRAHDARTRRCTCFALGELIGVARVLRITEYVHGVTDRDKNVDNFSCTDVDGDACAASIESGAEDMDER
jgi:hypothetical protein